VSHDVIFSATARRNLQRIPPRIVPAIVEFAFGDLVEEPRRVGKPLLRELEALFGARRGPYRIPRAIDDHAKRVEILRIDHCSGVYRNG